MPDREAQDGAPRRQGVRRSARTRTVLPRTAKSVLDADQSVEASDSTPVAAHVGIAPRRKSAPRSPAEARARRAEELSNSGDDPSTPAPEEPGQDQDKPKTRTRAAAKSKAQIAVETSGMHTVDGRPAEPPQNQTPPRPVSRNLDPSQLYRGRARMALMRDLAMGEWSNASIAASVGVPTEIIEDFRETYETEISEVRAALAGQLAVESAGLWISKRQNRISELQSDFEDIDLVIDVMRKNTKEKLNQDTKGNDSVVKGDAFDTDLLLGSRRHQNLLRAKIAVLRAVADEYAPNKQKKDQEQEDNTIKYVITSDAADGDDILEALT